MRTKQAFRKGYRAFLAISLPVSIVTLLSASTVKAATKTWVPTTGGAWTTDGNWSPNGQPVNGDDVVINKDQSANISAVPTMWR
jgi:hypothetical protein